MKWNNKVSQADEKVCDSGIIEVSILIFIYFKSEHEDIEDFF